LPTLYSENRLPIVIATLSKAKGKQSHSHYPELASGLRPSQRQPIFMIRWWATAHDGLFCGGQVQIKSAPRVAFHTHDTLSTWGSLIHYFFHLLGNSFLQISWFLFSLYLYLPLGQSYKNLSFPWKGISFLY